MNTNTKKRIYVLLFIVLGFLVGMVVHGLVEMWYINKLIENFPKYSFGYSWDNWFTIHKYFAGIIFVLSIWTGYFQGRYWWRLVYVEKRFNPFFKKLRRLFIS